MNTLFLVLCLLVGVIGRSSTGSSIDHRESIEVTPDDREGIFQLFLQPEIDHGPREFLYVQQINQHIQEGDQRVKHSKQSTPSKHQSTPSKHQHHEDYVNLLEDGAHAKVLAQVNTGAKMQLFNGALENIKRILQLVSAITITIGDHAFAGINAGLSLLGLGGGVSVGLSVQLGVIPKLANVITNFFDQYYDENHETSTVLLFLRSFQQKITALNENKPACNNLSELLKSITIGFEIGIDISITRGLMSLGVAVVLPTIGIHFGVPVARIGATGIACLSEMTASGLLYFGDRNPTWSGWAKKGASALTGTSHALRNFMTIFEGTDSIISVGHGIDIGKGAFGVGLGLTLSCQRKQTSKAKNAITSCTTTLNEILEKITKKIKTGVNAVLHPTRRRRLLRHVRRFKVLADHVQAVSDHHDDGGSDGLSNTGDAKEASLMSMIEVSKKHMDEATKRYQVLHEQEQSSSPSIKTTSFLEEMQLQKAHEKFVILTTLLLISIGKVVAGAIKDSNSQYTMSDIKHIETVLGPMTNNAFRLGVQAQVKDDPRKCIDGITVGLDYINWSLGGGYFVGPLTHCFEKACEKIQLTLKLGDAATVRKKCLKYRTLAGNLLLEKPNWQEKQPETKAGGEDKAVYRWKIYDAKKQRSDGWSGEIDIPWGATTPQPFEIPNVKSGKQSYMALQFRIPRGHDVTLQILTTNSDKLDHFSGAYTDCIMNKPWQGRSEIVNQEYNNYSTLDVLSPRGEYQKDRLLYFGPKEGEQLDLDIKSSGYGEIYRTAPRTCGGPGRKFGKGFQYKCSDTTNYYLQFKNLNEWQDSEIKLKFVKHLSSKCGGKKVQGVRVSKEGQDLQPVTIGTIVKQSTQLKVGDVGKRQSAQSVQSAQSLGAVPVGSVSVGAAVGAAVIPVLHSELAKVVGKFGSRKVGEVGAAVGAISAQSKDFNYFKVVGRANERIDETCCSQWCDGMYCAPPTEHALEVFKDKGIQMKAPHGECKRTREFFRNQWEQRKEELTLIAPKDEAEKEQLTEEKKKKLKKKQKEVETALLLIENDVISQCKRTETSYAMDLYRLARIPHPDVDDDGSGNNVDVNDISIHTRKSFQPVFEENGDRAEWIEGFKIITKEDKEQAELYEDPPTFFGSHPNDIPIDNDIVIDNNDAAPDQPSTETHEPVTSEPTQKDMDTISEEDRTKYLKELDDLEKKYYGVIPTEKLTELYGKYNLDTASLKGRSRLYGKYDAKVDDDDDDVPPAPQTTSVTPILPPTSK